VLWETLQESIDRGDSRGDSAWELNLYGEKGGWEERFLREGCRGTETCPRCGTAVVKVKMGSTSWKVVFCGHG
jgi:formamidopyrimidine-DNA glycosylase